MNANVNTNSNHHSPAGELDAYLEARQRGEHCPQPSALSAQEIDLADQLLALAETSQPDPHFAADLEKRLQAAQVAAAQPPVKSRMAGRIYALQAFFSDPIKRKSLMLKRIAFSLAGAAVLVLLIIFALPLLNPTELPLLPSLGSVSALAQGGGSGEVSQSGFFTGTEFVLQTDLPEAPQRIPVFQLDSMQVDVAAMRQLAARFDVHGPVYLQRYTLMGDNGSEEAVSYIVFDGSRRVTLDDWGDIFYSSGLATANGNALPSDQAVKIAEQFIKEHALLSVPYRFEEYLEEFGSVNFVPLVDGRPSKNNQQIQVNITPDGQVGSVFYKFGYDNLVMTGRYPLRSASDAWNALISGQLPNGRLEFTIDTPAVPAPDSQTWSPRYRPGEWAEISGMAMTFAPAPGESGSLRVQVGATMLSASPETLQELSNSTPTDSVRVWGQVRQAEDAGMLLDVEGWEVVAAEPGASITGVIQRQGEQVFLLRDDGQIFTLLHTSEDLVDGLAVSGAGWQTSQVVDGYPVLEWNYLQSPPAQPVSDDSGEGMYPSGSSTSVAAGGGTEDVEPAPAPPLEPGQAVDGLEGQLLAFVSEHPDGSRTVEAWLNEKMPLSSVSSGGGALGWGVLLTGDGMAGIEQLDRLWVRVWGTYANEDGQPTIQVERYEQAYPDQQYQAWLGKGEMKQVDGRNVAVLTTRDGQQYVLAYSVQNPDWPQSYLSPHAQMIVEGVLRTDTFGGYQVIEETITQSASSALTDLKDYQLSPRPEVSQAFGEFSLLPATVYVTKVELVYFFNVASLSVLAGDPALRFVQPVWSFSGYTEDGSTFEIFIQAVDDQYVQ